MAVKHSFSLTRAPLGPLLLLPYCLSKILSPSTWFTSLLFFSVISYFRRAIILQICHKFCKGNSGTAQYSENYDWVPKGKSNIDTALPLCAAPARISASGPHLTFPQSESLCCSTTSSSSLQLSSLCLFPSRMCMGNRERISELQRQRV